MTDANATRHGLATDAVGNLVDMPRDLVHSVNAELFDLLALLHGAMNEVDELESDAGRDPDGISDAGSRATCLLRMGADKLRTMLKTISPYV